MARSVALHFTGRRYGCSLIYQSTATFAGDAETGSGTSYKGGTEKCSLLTEESRYGVVLVKFHYIF